MVRFRRMGKVLSGAVGVLVGVVLCARLFAGHVRQYAVSPNGANIAEWREYDESSATTSNVFAVELRPRFNPFRHRVLEGFWATTPSLTWIDSGNLLVECGSCGRFEVKCDTCDQGFYVVSKENRWHDIAIHYGKP
jgi:hypothetical protein